MAFTEYSYKFLHRPINIRTPKPLDAGFLDYIAQYIARYKAEISLTNIQSSANRFNQAPIQFPFAVDTLFLDYLYELYRTLDQLNLLEKSFMRNPDSLTYDDYISFDPYEELVLKKTHISLTRELLYSSILIGFLHDLLLKHSESFSISSGKYFVGKNARKLDSNIENSATIQHEFVFEYSGFPMTQNHQETKQFELLHKDLQTLEAFTFLQLNSERELLQKAGEFGIVVEEVNE